MPPAERPQLPDGLRGCWLRGCSPRAFPSIAPQVGNGLIRFVIRGGRIVIRGPRPSGAHHAFVEIGTADFDSLIDGGVDGGRGISVDPLPTHLERLPSHERVAKVCSAISRSAGRSLLWYVSRSDTEAHALPDWVPGACALDRKHPHVARELRERGLERLWQSSSVDTIPFGDLCERQRVSSIAFLKVDTEGHDPQVLFSFLEWATNNRSGLPEVLQFESNRLADEEEEEEVLERLQVEGYELCWRGFDSVLRRSEKHLPRPRDPERYAWANQLRDAFHSHPNPEHLRPPPSYGRGEV
eukprot:Hpha_TRINITY_DN15651_c0_g1::TRINITY_DN15651_c0_g1_i2::g.100500::m.100500